MAQKILVNYAGSISNEALASKKQSVADHLGVCPEDVILLPGLTVSVVDLPDELTKAREKADKEAAAEAEKAKQEQEQAELKAIQAQQAEAAKNAPPAPTPAPPAAPKAAAKADDYDSWTLADLHDEAGKRDLPGRSGLDKAGLVKALQKSDKADKK